MKYLVISLLLCLSACSTTVPVVMKFPEAPKVLMEKCPPLKVITEESVSIVDLTKITTTNYTSYYECAVKVDTWIEWYHTQKKIFEEVK